MYEEVPYCVHRFIGKGEILVSKGVGGRLFFKILQM